MSRMHLERRLLSFRVDGYFNDFYILRENERIWCFRISHDENHLKIYELQNFPSRNVLGSLLKSIHMWKVFGYFYASAWTRSKVKAEIRVSWTGLISVDYQHLPAQKVVQSAFSSLSTCLNQQPIKFIRFVAFCHSHFRLQPDKPICWHKRLV